MHENFFLLPLGFGMIGLGMITVLIGLAYYWKKTGDVFYVINKMGYIATAVFVVGTLLIYANASRISVEALVLSSISIVMSIIAKMKIKR